YDVNPNKFGQVNRLITLAKNYGTPKEQYHGVDFAVNARFGKGGLLQGGVSIGRESVDYCYANGRPDLTPENFPGSTAQFTTSPNYPRNAAYCHVVSPWLEGIGSQVKVQGVYPLAYGVRVSGTFKNIPGIPQTASLVASNATVAASLGRSLAACPATGTCTATVTNQIVPFALNTGSTAASAVLFDERLNEFDVRVTKAIELARWRVQPMVDLYNVF